MFTNFINTFYKFYLYLQTSDFSWKYIWTAQPNSKVYNAQKIQKQTSTNVQIYKIGKNTKYKKTA